MTAVDVDALDKLREAATAGEWQVSPDWQWGIAVVNPATPARDVFVECDHRADVALIVAMHAALPDLLAEVRRGRALREALEGLAREHEKWARINAGLASEDMGGPDLHDGMRRAQEATTKHLRAVLAAVDPS